MSVRGKASVAAKAGQIVSMVAKFSSVCKCGAFIEPGDSMSYDTLSRKSLCYDCLRKQTEFAEKNADPNAVPEPKDEKCHALIDRFRELRLTVRPLSVEVKGELHALLTRFKNEFAASEPVRAFVAEIAKCKHSGAEFCPIKAKYPGACIHCGSAVVVGDLVLYDHHVRRIHCLSCDCLRGL